MHRFRHASLASFVAMTLALAACGSSNDEADSSPEATTPATAAATESNTSEESDSDSEGGSEAVTVTTLGDVPGVSDACESILNFIGATGQILGGQIDAATGRGLVDDFLGAVSDEIRADATVLANSFTALLDVIEQYGDFASAIINPEAQQAFAALEGPDYTEATDNISAYLAAECPFGG